jgi:hypothetical protein
VSAGDGVHREPAVLNVSSHRQPAATSARSSSIRVSGSGRWPPSS